jgi:hypothetical protein
MAVHEFSRARSIPQLFTDVVNQFTSLLGHEMRLARAEFSENVSRLAIGLGFIIGGAVLLIPALVVLLEAAVAGLIEGGFAPYWAALIVGGAALLIGIILLLIGISRIKPENLMPKKTVEQVRRDAVVAVQQVRNPNGVTDRAA